MGRTGARLAVAFACVWLLGLLAAPYLLAHGLVRQRSAVSWVVASTYVTGSFICHQRPDRSFHPWGVQMPVCGRCAGLYAGVAIGAGVAYARARDPRPSLRQSPAWRRALVAASLPTVALVGIEASGLWAPSSLLRAIGAAPLGAAVAALVVTTLRRLR